MGVFVRADSPFYWLLLERSGEKPVRRATKIRHSPTTQQQRLENRKTAEVAYNAAMLALAKGDLGIEAPAGPSLADFWTKTYRPWVKKNYPDAVRETTRVITTLFLPTMGTIAIGRITPAMIHVWWDTRTSQPQSRFRELTHLRGLLARAVTLGVLPAHPLEALDIATPPTREIIRYLSAEEYARLTVALTARDDTARTARINTNTHRTARRKAPLPEIGTYADALHPAMLLSIHAGIRRKELFQAHWSAIDWQADILTVEWWTTKRNRKRTAKSRRIPLNAIALAALKAWHADHGAPKRGLIFPGAAGQPLTNLQTSFETVLETADIEDFRWHDMRHTFASWLVQKGVSLYRVQQWMGHASITTTMRYAHLAPDHGKEEVGRLVPAPLT